MTVSKCVSALASAPGRCWAKEVPWCSGSACAAKTSSNWCTSSVGERPPNSSPPPKPSTLSSSNGRPKPSPEAAKGSALGEPPKPPKASSAAKASRGVTWPEACGLGEALRLLLASRSAHRTSNGSKFCKARTKSDGNGSCNWGTRAPRRAQVTRCTRQTNSGNDKRPSWSRSECCHAASRTSWLKPERPKSSVASAPTTYPSSSQSVFLNSVAYFLSSRRDGAHRSCVNARGDLEPLLRTAWAALAVVSSPVWITGNMSDASLPPFGEPCSEVSDGARWRWSSSSGSIWGSCASNSGDGCCPAWACATRRQATKKRSMVRWPVECGSEMDQILWSTS
mmetsp:Transcript_107804/g.301875  ORF Transcript_107804/g.301875 Transcript_107804/m.301875 type:complete len:338 (-) Transcript_107804:291-1304(-)